MTKHYSDQAQKILASIKITRMNLYVFKNSEEKNKWSQLLDEAERSVLDNENYIYADKLIGRVNEVIDALWKRIFRWQKIQKQVTIIFLIAIPVELVIVGLYVYFVNIIQYGVYTSMLFGLLGGSLGVALNIGKDLKIEGSNRLQMLRLILRPFVGVVSAIVLFYLLQTKVIYIAPSINQESALILLSLFAGFSERFLVKAFSDYIPRVIK